MIVQFGHKRWRSVKMWAINFYKSFFKTILSYMNSRLSKSCSVHTYVQSMSERCYFELHSEQCSFFWEHKASAILFRQKESKVNTAKKNWWAQAKSALFFALFFGHSARLLIQYFAAFLTSKLTIMPTTICNLSEISSFEQIAQLSIIGKFI